MCPAAAALSEDGVIYSLPSSTILKTESSRSAGVMYTIAEIH